MANIEKFTNSLAAYVGDDLSKEIIDVLGIENIKKAPFGNTHDSGGAYIGGWVDNVLSLTAYACKINSLLPTEEQVNKESIVKVCLLSHIAKVIMWEDNDNSWEKTNRGILYKYVDLKGALRYGERSILIAMNAGVTFTEEEFEAMRIMDKANDDDNYTKYFSSTLSMVIRQANEIVTMINKNKMKH